MRVDNDINQNATTEDYKNVLIAPQMSLARSININVARRERWMQKPKEIWKVMFSAILISFSLFSLSFSLSCSREKEKKEEGNRGITSALQSCHDFPLEPVHSPVLPCHTSGNAVSEEQQHGKTGQP